MYVDKKLAGVDCVQTLSRLNRTYAGKDMTFVLDFVNEPEDILAAFKPYYQTAELAGVSDPNLIYDLFGKLGAEKIYQWHEVEAFATAFFDPKQSQDAIARHCKPALQRWQQRYRLAVDVLHEARRQLKLAESNEAGSISVDNGNKSVKDAKEVKDALDNFKKDLGSFVRFYEFMSQVIDYDDIELEKLNVYARHLLPLLREERIDEDIDLSDVVMTHYRLSKIREQRLHLQNNSNLQDDKGEYQLQPTDSLGSAKAHDMQTALLSEIVQRMNDLFTGDKLTEKDLINYANTIADKIRENDRVMDQLNNNSAEQAMLGDFPSAVLDAVIDSRNTHNDLAMQYLSDEKIAKGFARLLLDMLVKAEAG
jgi:type I restriction enzyme R subunit